MKILLDNSVLTHSEFAVPAVRTSTVRWGIKDCPSEVHGVERKPRDKNVQYQEQIDALFTVGRLIRNGRIEAYSYIELECERMRDSPKLGICNAFNGCRIHACEPAINRGRFRQTIDITEWMSKGVRKDIKNHHTLSDANQSSFLVWIYGLTAEQDEVVLSHAQQLRLTDFDVASFKDLAWFRYLCSRAGSTENYVDVFHFWTAERNRLNAFLTLDRTFQNIIANVKREQGKPREMSVEVLRPLDLLVKLGITELDPVPMEFGRLYHLHEL